MATSGKQDQSSEMSCSMCFEQYRLPKILQCSHVYCHLCLNSLASNKPARFDCPISRQTVHVTPGDVGGLPIFSCIGCSREKNSPSISVWGKTEQSVNFAESSVADPTKNVPSKLSLDRKPLSQKVFSCVSFTTNPQSNLESLTLSAENKLWTRHKPPNNFFSYLCVYESAEGKMLGKWINESIQGSSLTCLGDRLLSPLTWQWIDVDGKSGKLDIAPNKWALCSKSLPPHIVLQAPAPDKGKVVLTVHCLQQQSADPLVVTMIPVIVDGLVDIITFDGEPTAFGISTDRRWLAFLTYSKIRIFYTECKSAKAFSAYSCNGDIEDVTFTTRNREVVLVATYRYGRVLIYDFQEGFAKLACVHPNISNFYRHLAAHNDGKMFCELCKGFISSWNVGDACLCSNCSK